MGKTSKIVAGLTPRKVQVCTLITGGWNNREIATKLKISPNTVKAHLHHLFDLFDCHTRTELAVCYVQGASSPTRSKPPFKHQPQGRGGNR